METYRSILIEEMSAIAGVDLGYITVSAMIREDLPIDSLALLTVFLRVEERLGIELDEEALSRAETVGDLVACIAAATPEEASR